jgi:retinol dehydrogenase-12
MSFKSSLTQAFPPQPAYTEKDVPDLENYVFVVTGASAGVGKELTRMLYSKNAKVYMMARSKDKTTKAIDDITQAVPSSRGSLIFIHLDLADLSTIKSTVDIFLSQEDKLHVLVNNAGIMSSEKKLVTTPQGFEQHVGINVLGPYLLTRLLTPTLIATAKVEPANKVRVVWLGSSASEMFAVKNVGATAEMMSADNLAKKSGNERYWLSKVGNWAHNAEYALRYRADGVVSVAANPGNLQSELYRDQGLLMRAVTKLIMYPPVNGAYTELYAALSPDITLANTGCWVIPFGRVYPIRKDLDNAIKEESQGGTGGTKLFWDWSEEQVRAYLGAKVN